MAFIPNPLPPKIELDWKLVQSLSEADRAVSELSGLARNLTNPHLLISPFLKNEAVLSSRIEGTQASLSDLFLFESDETNTRETSDVQEVVNYVRALEHGLNRLQSLPLSLRLMREMHEILMKGVRGDHATPGEFRRSQNWIGPPGCTLNEATYVPPPRHEMNQSLDLFERYLHARSELPALIRIGMIHYQFEAIHPFIDGNGRIGRLLISLLLIQDGVLKDPLLYLSAFFEKNRQQYYDRLLAVSRKGDWINWLIFFLRGVSDQSRDAIDRITRLMALWSRYRDQFKEARSSVLLLRLVDTLVESPVITVPKAAKILNVTHRSASLNIGKLIDAGILREATGRARHRIYIADEIFKVVEVG